jgi:hypothetical protein
MNGFADHGLDETAFGEKKGNIVQAFDAFRKNFLIFPILLWISSLWQLNPLNGFDVLTKSS